MNIRFAIQFLSVIIFGQVIVVYFITENTPSWKEEIVMLARLSSLSLMYWLVESHLMRPLDKIAKAVSDVLIGNEMKKYKGRNAAIGKVYEAFAHTTENIKNATNFIEEIGKGALDIDYKTNNKQEDKLAASLIRMRDQMKQFAKEEAQRKWVNEGLAKFVGILRSENNDLALLSNNIVSTLVDYMNVQQGGIFLLEEHRQERTLVLVAAYAYQRKKYIEKRVPVGEGLLGQAFEDKATIFMNNLPADYTTIMSGLGGAPATCLLIVPLKNKDEVLGVIELTAFEDILPYQIELVEKLAESIAATVSAVRSNEQTQRLLYEAQEFAAQLRAQEEEMRQNMEEMQATQEEMQRKQQELENSKTDLEQVAKKTQSNEAILKKYLERQKNIEKQLREEIETLKTR